MLVEARRQAGLNYWCIHKDSLLSTIQLIGTWCPDSFLLIGSSLMFVVQDQWGGVHCTVNIKGVRLRLVHNTSIALLCTEC